MKILIMQYRKNQTFTKKQFIVHFIDERLNTKIADCEKKYLAFSHNYFAYTMEWTI